MLFLLAFACRKAPGGVDDSPAGLGDTGHAETGEGCAPEPETPYDGMDQDCDGADLADVDGDGFDAVQAGGDDCDDEDPSTHPGADEVRGDGVDDDCDGRVDEYLVCWDGTGDFLTIQEGVDGVDDGSVLEVCSGTYVENVAMTGRDLTIEGEDPIGVVLEPADPGGIALLATGGRLSLANLSFDASGEATCTGVYGDRMLSMSLERLDLCMCEDTLTGLGVDDDDGGDLWVTSSNFCAGTISTGANTFTFARNILVGGVFLASDVDVAHVENNLWATGLALIWFSTNSCYSIDGCPDGFSLEIENNTFVDSSGLSIAIDVEAYDHPMPDVFVRNNIFANSSTAYEALWNVHWVDAGLHDVWEGAPAEWKANIVFGLDRELAYFYSGTADGSSSTQTTSYSETLASDSILADPEFLADPEGAGSYALSEGSPAVDAGIGVDADGSPADIGAFGGSEGDWWREVPWPLP